MQGGKEDSLRRTCRARTRAEQIPNKNFGRKAGGRSKGWTQEPDEAPTAAKGNFG